MVENLLRGGLWIFFSEAKVFGSISEEIGNFIEGIRQRKAQFQEDDAQLKYFSEEYKCPYDKIKNAYSSEGSDLIKLIIKINQGGKIEQPDKDCIVERIGSSFIDYFDEGYRHLRRLSDKYDLSYVGLKKLTITTERGSLLYLELF